MVGDFFRREAFVHQGQIPDDVADVAVRRRAIDDSRVRRAGGGEAKEVAIVGEDDPMFTQCEAPMFLVAGVQETCIAGRRHVDLSTLKAVRYGVRDVFI